jgi:hypothetical protein
MIADREHVTETHRLPFSDVRAIRGYWLLILDLNQFLPEPSDRGKKFLP